MKVILTHTNADCDAIASLLAMHKLEPEARPVLPPRLNQNIQQFLLLYARDWPFTSADELPRNQKVSLAYVVDTQGFNMVRGMTPDTPVYIIDHHRPSPPFPPHHTFTGEQTGANVTLLAEKLLGRGIMLSPLEATLLLLGIYEDTGRLSYKSTTPRDLQAAAWLLDQGADLDIVVEFLAHTLSPDQARLLDRLQQSALSLKIKGHSVGISSAVLGAPIAEAARLAYELLGRLGCDALFIALQIEDQVQIICRSTVDEIALGDLMAHFKGRGHTRAAAGLVSGAGLEETLSRLIDLLPDYTQAAVRVESLMSLGAQTLAAQISIGQAQEQMNQSGHEGYPVLENGHLVGLLTRRAVDRAMLHGLHKNPLRDIMEPGQHHVLPSDPIELLKDRILATGWGQMPVLDEGGRLIGIVTRTDLIKHWGRHPQEPGQQMIERLRGLLSDPVWALLESISAAAEGQNKGLFLVGGIVRDLLLERPNLDIDLVVEGEAIELARALQHQYGGRLHTHPQFGTATWTLTEEAAALMSLKAPLAALPPSIDFATSRAEFYAAPSALPTVWRGSIKLDLHRRDFSINALAIRLAPRPMGYLLDFYHGEQDLRAGLIRVLHSLSFIDDPTRMLRALRFEQRFGFQIEARTLALMQSALPMLERVSGERLQNELKLMLAEADPAANFARMADLGILPQIHPALALPPHWRDYEAAYQALRTSPPWAVGPDLDWGLLQWAVWYQHLPGPSLEDLGRRLLLPKQELKHLIAASQGYAQLASSQNLGPSQFVGVYEKLGELAWLANWIAASDSGRARLENLARHWRHVRPALKGEDLAALGIPKGPRMGQLLAEIRAARLDGDLQGEGPDAEVAYLQTRL
jgi:tRNA nucleotidyltransferase (CCA-adding enzyme)